MHLSVRSDLENELFYDVYTAGDPAQHTLYLIGPYKGRPLYIRFFVWRMTCAGLRVVYLQSRPEILSSKQPKWLGKSIKQAISYIQADMNMHSSKEHYLMGISLGSYLGLNVQLEIPFKKFVVVAGGAPLMGVFRSSFMFRADRKRIAKHAGGYKKLQAHWEPYDHAFKSADLRGSATLFLNSKNDRVIPNEAFSRFLESYKKTGVRIVNRQRGYLIHTLKALSINFRNKEVEDFLKGEERGTL